MNTKTEQLITYVAATSVAGKAGIELGDILLKINDKQINDVFDYRYLISDRRLNVLVRKKDGAEQFYRIAKREHEDLGIEFDSGLMDNARSCSNKCIFCFIDQLPKGMRNSLYFKDDDSRLSFLSGNYVTLTNISDEDFERVRFYHLSPINISVHSADPDLRARMLNNPRASKILEYIEKLHESGIEMNFQIVLCKGVNDGERLDYTIAELGRFIPGAKSLSVVPVGLTGHRDGLYPLESFTKEDSASVIAQVNRWQEHFSKSNETRFVYAADEFYINAGIEIPGYDEYEDFPQLENGVGMLALFMDEFEYGLEQTEDISPDIEKTVSVVTGKAAEHFVTSMASRIEEKFNRISVNVFAIENNFFGGKVTVSGLLTGTDIIEQLKDKPLGDYLLLPVNCLRHGETVLLDDITVEGIEKALKTRIIVVECDGKSFVDAVVKEYQRAAVEKE